MNHETDLEGGLPKLAEDIGNLRYDALAGFLRLLADKLRKDSEADHERGRCKLARSLADAADAIDRAWRISEPYMKEQQ
jgi:hypothetical protein